MAHSFVKILVHVVFSTSNREPIIGAEFSDRLHQYLGGIIRAPGGHAFAINGMPDHVHILMAPPPDKSIADVMRTIKSNSSCWVSDTIPSAKGFSWQTGYSAFSVSQSAL